MELNFFDPELVVMQRDQILAHLRSHVSLGDFVLISNTLHKHINEALEENRRFEESIKSDSDPFVQDVRNEDPLAFVIRGALHLEEAVSELLKEMSINPPNRADLNTKIRLLSDSNHFSADGIDLLHRVRKLRNAVAHELESGRDVLPEAVNGLKADLSDERLSRLTKVCGSDPRGCPVRIRSWRIRIC